MPRNDAEHDVVIRALQNDGWQIADEQITLIAEDRHLWIDLEAVRASDRLFIFVEVKGFKSTSPVSDFAAALGQFLLYRHILNEEYEAEVPLYIAVPQSAFSGILSEKLARAMRQKYDLKLIVVDMDNEVIVQWIPIP
jgi:hypothetical protein